LVFKVMVIFGSIPACSKTGSCLFDKIVVERTWASSDLKGRKH
jgi:hypothetical protein